MTRSRRSSPQAVAVLTALAAAPATWRYGYELGQEVGLKAGSLYPILMRLSDRGMLEATWEADPPAGRPARHLYRLTAPGLALAEESMAEAGSPAQTRPAALPERRTGAARTARSARTLRGAW